MSQNNKEKFIKIFNVSRETIKKLDYYCQLVSQANLKMNLVSNKSINDIWLRHFADSLKIFFIMKENLKHQEIDSAKVCDIGTGAGFPGGVVQIMFDQHKLKTRIDLIESVRKKCVFLEYLKSKLNTNFSVINKRCENIKGLYDIIMCRAVSPLKKLIPMLYKISHSKTVFFLSKGRRWQTELDEIKNNWKFNLDIVNNNKILDNTGGVTLIVKNLGRK